MEKLENLALEHIMNLADELDSECISLGNRLGIDKEIFDAEIHSYPLANKARTIKFWAEAILKE